MAYEHSAAQNQLGGCRSSVACLADSSSGSYPRWLRNVVERARVEAQRHYPSDVLAGTALGHFLTAFIHDAFLNLPENADVDFAVFGVEGGAGVELAFRF